MAAIIRRVVYQLTAGQSSGTFDITHPDITTPDCWIGFISGSTAVDGSRQTHAHVGVFSGHATGMLGLGNRARGGLGSTSTARSQNTHAHLINDTSNNFAGIFNVNSLISGGVRFEYSNAFARNFQLELFLIEGCEEVSLEQNTNLDNGTYSGMSGYPDLMFVYGTTGGTSSPQTTSKASIGFATRNPADNSIYNQWALGWDIQNNQNNVKFYGGASEDTILNRTSTDSWFEFYSLASFNPDGYSFSNVSNSLTGARILAIRFPADQQVISGIRQFAIGLGADSIPIAYNSGSQDSDFVFIGAADSINNDTVNVNRFNALCFGGADRNLDQSAVAYIDQDGNGTSQSESQFDNSNIINYAQGGTGTVYKTTSVTSLDGGQITLDHSVNNGEAAWYGWWTLQSGAVGPPPGEDEEITLTTANATATAHAPTVTVEDTQNIGLPTANLDAAASAPDVEGQNTQNITLTTANLDLTSHAPGVETVIAPEDAEVGLPTANSDLAASAPDVQTQITQEIGLPTANLDLTSHAPGVATEKDADVGLPTANLDATAHPPSVEAEESIQRTPILGIPTNPKANVGVDETVTDRPDYTVYLYGETSFPVPSIENPLVGWEGGNDLGVNPGGITNDPVWELNPRGEGPELWFSDDVNRTSQILGLQGTTRPFTLLTIVYQPLTNVGGDRGVVVFGDGGTADDDYVGHWQDTGVAGNPFFGYGELQSDGRSRSALGTDQHSHVPGDYSVLVISAEDQNNVQTYAANVPTDSEFFSTGNMADNTNWAPIPDFPLNRLWIGSGRADTGTGTPLFLDGYAIAFMAWESRALTKAQLDNYLSGGLFQHITLGGTAPPGDDTIFVSGAKLNLAARAPSVTAPVDANINPATAQLDLTATPPSVEATEPPVVCPAKQPGYCIAISEQTWYDPNDPNYSTLVDLGQTTNFFDRFNRTQWARNHPNFTVFEMDFRWNNLEHEQDNYTGLHDMLDHAVAWRDDRLSDPQPMTLNLAFYAGTDRWGAQDGQKPYGPDYIHDNPNIYYGDDRGGIEETHGGVYRRNRDTAAQLGKLTIPWSGTAPNHPGNAQNPTPVTNRDRSPWRGRFTKILIEAYKYLKSIGRESLLEYVIISSETAKGVNTLRELESYTPQGYKDAIIEMVGTVRAGLDAEGGTHVGVLMGCNYFMSGIKKGEWAQDLLDPIRDAGGGIGLQDPKMSYGGDTDKQEIIQWMRENNGVAPCWMEGDEFFLTTLKDPVTNQPLDPVRYTKSANGTLEDEYPEYLTVPGYPAGGWFPHYMRWIWTTGGNDPTGTAGTRWLNAVDTIQLTQQVQCGQYPVADINPPGISPAAGIYLMPQTITITEDPQADATYYVVGATATTPTPSDNLYTVPFQITGTSVVSARSLKGTLWTATVTRSYSEQGTTGGRSPILRIPQDSRSLLSINANAVNRPLYTFYWAGGPVNAEVASFEDENVQLLGGAGTDEGAPDFLLNPNGEGPEIYFFSTQESLYIPPGPSTSFRPVTFMCIERFTDGLSFPNSQRAAWCVGDGDINRDGTRSDGDYFSIWKTGDGTSTFGAYGEQASQGNSRGFWNATRFALDPSRYRYQVISYASGTDCKAFIANDDDVAFTPLGDMTEGFTSPLTDWEFRDVWIGGGRVDASSPIPVWGGHVIGFLIWGEALTEAELNELLNRPNKFFDHIVTGADNEQIGLPTASATVTAHPPTTEYPVYERSNLNTANLDLAGQAPTITTVEGTEDSQIGIPRARSDAMAYPPAVEAQDTQSITLTTANATAAGQAPDLEAEDTNTVTLGTANSTVAGYPPSISTEETQSVTLPTANSTVATSAPGIELTETFTVTVPAANAIAAGQAPDLDAGADDEIGLPTANLAMKSDPPFIQAGQAEETVLGTANVNLGAYAPFVQAQRSAYILLPTCPSLVLQGRAPRVDAGFDDIVYPTTANSTATALPPNITTIVNQQIGLPTANVTITGQPPGLEYDTTARIFPPWARTTAAASPPTVWIQAPTVPDTLQDGVELIKSILDPLLAGIGLTQVFWPNLPRKRDNETPFARIAINMEDRELADLGATPRTLGSVQIQVCTPYGWDPSRHDTYVNDCLALISDTSHQNVQFFTSVPLSEGRFEAFWMTRIETEFYIENV